jgi:type II secretory pathway pseudopilin PulG
MDSIRHYGLTAASQLSQQLETLHQSTGISSSQFGAPVEVYTPTRIEELALDKWRRESLTYVISYHRKISRKMLQVNKLKETSQKGLLTADLACLNLRPYQWPASMTKEDTGRYDSLHAESIIKALAAIQTDRLEKLTMDLEAFKGAYADHKLVTECMEKLGTICPRVIKYDAYKLHLLDGLARDILQTEVSNPPKPLPTPTIPSAPDAMESQQELLAEMRAMRAEMKALKSHIGRNKTLNPTSAHHKPFPPRSKANIAQKVRSPSVSYDEDRPFTLVKRGRSKSPKNWDRAGKGPQQNSTPTSKGSRSKGSREESLTSRTTRQSPSLHKNRNSRSPSPYPALTTVRTSNDGVGNRRGKGKHL